MNFKDLAVKICLEETKKGRELNITEVREVLSKAFRYMSKMNVKELAKIIGKPRG